MFFLRGQSGSGPPPTPEAPPPTEVVFTSGILEKVTGPLKILVGPRSPSMDITDKVAIDSISIEETGTHDEATAHFSIIDKDLLYTAMRGEWEVRIQHAGKTIFRGYIGAPSAEIRAIIGERAVTARDIGSLMDRLIVKSRIVRPAGETDKARIQWIFDTIGNPLIKAGMTDWSKVQVLNTEPMKKQTFPTRLTLRQCVERVLAASSDSSNYYVDMVPRLHTFDADNPENGWTAPKNVNVTSSPTSSELTPEDLKVDWDTDGLINSYAVRGKNAAGSGWYTDKDLLGEPWSIDIFGLRSAYIDAPDADTVAKARRVAKAAMRDTRNPIPRGSFTTTILADEQPYEAGQLLFVTSGVHGLNGSGADAGPWAGQGSLQPLRIVNVSTRYLNGIGDREQEIEFGGRRIHRYSASIG